MFPHPIGFIVIMVFVFLGFGLGIYFIKDHLVTQEERDIIFVHHDKTYPFIVENKHGENQCRNTTDNICRISYKQDVHKIGDSVNHPSNLNCATNKTRTEHDINKCVAALILALALLNY